jgi:hypothetical protein
MVGDRVFTQRDVDAGVKPGADIGVGSLGISAHAEDSHNMQRFACKDSTTPPCYGEGPRHATGPFAWDEGDYHCVKQGSGIYQLPAYMVLPNDTQASNLLVVAAPSASYGARFWADAYTLGCHRSHACSLGCHSSRKFIILPVDTVNCVATLKARGVFDVPDGAGVYDPG